MEKFKIAAVFTAFLLSGAKPADADFCDWRPSQFMGSAVAVAGAGLAGAAGAGMQAAGFYTLVHASSGLTMLGSTLAGASAAGTVGIIAGTGGVIGTIGAILMAPVTAVAAGAAVIGGVGMEVACHFTDERIDEYYEVLAIMKHLADHHDATQFLLVNGTSGEHNASIGIMNPENDEFDHYNVADLYLRNGSLWVNRPWRFDQNLGALLFVQPAAE